MEKVDGLIRDKRGIGSPIKRLLRPSWRWFLRFRRICRSAGKLSPVWFVEFAFIDLVLNPLMQRLQIHNRRMRIRVKGYDGPFVLRLGTSDAECLLEVILEEEYKTSTVLAEGSSKLVFDAGSNAGYSLRYFQRAFPSALIIGVEPDAENMRLCRENVSHGETPDRVRLFACCVASRQGVVSLDRSAGAAWAIRMKPSCQQPSNPNESVVSKTVDQLLTEAGLDGHRLDLFKCDIEGAEAEIFHDPGLWLNRTGCLAVETHGPYYDVCLMDDLRRNSDDFEFFPENELVFARRRVVRAQ